jgi:methyl-accepting chemotaxis protein
MLDVLFSVGVHFRDVVLFFAGTLKNPAAPGVVSLALIIVLITLIALCSANIRARWSAIKWLTALIKEINPDVDISSAIESLKARVKEESSDKSRRQLATAWNEYCETLVPHEEDGTIILRNSVRPSIFINAEDLQFDAGILRIVPGLFVTFGLFFTFLGLVSALHAMSDSGDAVNSGTMMALLSIASAKFIMSLTGILCSIIFTIFMRKSFGILEGGIHRLCAALEARLTFISLEYLAIEQLRAIREQREHFRLIGMEMVAELGRPLREELPAAISASISGAMAPLLEKVGKLGTEGVGEMVAGLSSRLTDTVGIALSEASQRLAEAGMKIGQLSDRMDQSSGRMGAEMEATTARVAQAVEDLRASMAATAETAGGAFTDGAEKLLAVMNQTLEGIRDNTGEGARAISAAAVEMRKSAEAFGEELKSAARIGTESAQARMQLAGAEASDAIGSAGQGVMDAFGKTSVEIARITKELSKQAGKDLLAPLGSLATQLDEMVSSIAQGTTDMRRMSDGVRAGADASAQAAGTFRGATADLVAAAVPIRAATEQIESSARQLAESTQNVATTVSRAAETTARSAADTLAAAQQVLGQEARAIESALSGVTQVLERLKGQGDRLDDMDEKLGNAFETYTAQVAKAVEGMFGHVQELQSRISPALDTMREIVEQAEQFAPQSRKK